MTRGSWTSVAVLLVGLSLAPGASRVAAAEGYTGAGALFELEHVTVVYPAGPGEDVETNRLSAQRRAAFLRAVHGVQADVVADTAANAETLERDLLLLGWSNRLLVTDAQPHPVVERNGGRAVLGQFELAPGEDLFFSTASPYASGRWLFFWSRIDLELDRFSVLPFEGSMWAVFRGYRVEGQGMFQAAEWPPQRDRSAEMLYHRTPPPASRRSEHYTVHFDPATIPVDHVASILEAREAAWAAAVRALGAPPEPLHIELYVYADEAEKKAASSVPDAIHSVPRERELYMTERMALQPGPHEEIHLLARALYGPCYLSALYEGLAVDGEQTGAPLARAVNAGLLRDQGKLPPLDTLLDEEAFRAATKDGSGFPAAALFVHWLRRVRMPEHFAALYGRRELSAATLAQELGLSAVELEAQFVAWVNDLAGGAETEVAYRKARGEADQARRAGDVESAVEALERALAVKPGDMPALLRLSSALTDAGRFEEAEKRLHELLRATEKPENERFASFVYYRLGKLYDIQGKFDEATQALEHALTLPDYNDVHKRVREAIAARSPAGGS